MNLLDRIILTIYMLLMVFVSFALIAIVMPFNLIPMAYLNGIVETLYSDPYKWYYALSGIVLLIVSLKLLLSGVRIDRRNRGGVVKPTEYGDIRVSIDTFESLALRAVKQISGIKDVKVRVDINEEDLTVYARLLVLPDINIPRTVSEVQGRIKEYIEQITEVGVKDVKVDIENVAQVAVPRVS
jgi:Uncharacterized protein conserved in bacteria